MRTPIIVANWKMNLNHLEAIALTQKLSYQIDNYLFEEAEVVLCPPFTDLRSVQTTIDSDKMKFKLGAQNVHESEKGAFTGEISAPMLAKFGTSYVLVGHSERRAHFGETNEDTALKIKSVMKFSMTPILCVGETREQRDNNESFDVVEEQVKVGLSKINKGDVENVVVAYEPVWAIGAGTPATIVQANEMIAKIRSVLFGIAKSTQEVSRVIYGASVDPLNARNFMDQDGIDGLLVGGASLKADDFSRLVISAIKN